MLKKTWDRLSLGGGLEKLTYESKNRAFNQVKHVHSTEVGWNMCSPCTSLAEYIGFKYKNILAACQALPDENKINDFNRTLIKKRVECNNETLETPARSQTVQALPYVSVACLACNRRTVGSNPS